jgi:hypothetical protein
VEVARIAYEYIRKNGFQDETVSRGLHHASRSLRDQWVDNEDKARHRLSPGLGSTRHATLDRASEYTSPPWVPFVHFGV